MQEHELLRQRYCEIVAKFGGLGQPGYNAFSGPDLILLARDYLGAARRVAIIGKEQDDWAYRCAEFFARPPESAVEVNDPRLIPILEIQSELGCSS